MKDPRFLLYERGYDQLVSVIPPGATLSPNSKIPDSAKGKAPGEQGRDGKWYGTSGWQTKPSPTEHDIKKWFTWEANIGLKADRFPALDIDSPSPEVAEEVRKLALHSIGAAPVRGRSNSAKVLLPYQLGRGEEPFGKMALEIIDPEGTSHLIEILGRGNQYLVLGDHPSGVPYTWRKSALWELSPHQLAEISADTARAFLDTVERVFTERGWEVRRRGRGNGNGKAPPQQQLQAPSDEELQALVEQLPNDERYHGRDEYITFGHAVKAAAHDEETGFGIFDEWAGRWEDGAYEPETIRDDWRRMQPPYRVGWGWLVDQLPPAEAAQVTFEADPSYTAPTREAGPLAEMLEQYAVVARNGDVSTLDTYADTPVFYSDASMRMLYANRRVKKHEEAKPVSVYELWKTDPRRRTYHDLVFAPGQTAMPEGVYNIWKGWGVEPDPQGVYPQRFMDHLLHAICGGDEDACDRLLDWMAHMFQRPQEKPGQALGLHGLQGEGKSMLGYILGQLLGQGYVVINNVEQLTQRFNAHLHGAILVQLDEAIWAGDRRAENKLKDLITGTTQLVEPKGVDAYTVESFFRVLVTTNNLHAVPVSVDDRRWTVHHVKSGHANDRAYFKPLFEELEAGGYERLLHELLTREIDEDRLFGQLPVTDALREQAQMSLHPHEEFILDLLEYAELPVGCEVAENGEAIVPLQLLMDRCNQQLPGNTFRFTARRFGPFLRDMLNAKESGYRPRVHSTVAGEIRTKELVLPPLEECRKRYSARGRAAQQEWPSETVSWTVEGA